MTSTPTTMTHTDRQYARYLRKVQRINQLVKPSNRIRPLSRQAWNRRMP